MDESSLTAARRIHLHACRADACQQGRAQCPCPSECALPDVDLPWSWIEKFIPPLQRIALALFFIFTLALLAGYFFTKGSP